MARQCKLLDVNRSGYHYQPQSQSEQNRLFMQIIDELYTKTQFYGNRRMNAWQWQQGFPVKHKRVIAVDADFVVASEVPGPNTSHRRADHRIYPYLLRGVAIVVPDQVWSADITRIRLWGVFLYLTAVINWFSQGRAG